MNRDKESAITGDRKNSIGVFPVFLSVSAFIRVHLRLTVLSVEGY